MRTVNPRYPCSKLATIRHCASSASAWWFLYTPSANALGFDSASGEVVRVAELQGARGRERRDKSERRMRGAGGGRAERGGMRGAVRAKRETLRETLRDTLRIFSILSTNMSLMFD